MLDGFRRSSEPEAYGKDLHLAEVIKVVEKLGGRADGEELHPEMLKASDIVGLLRLTCNVT